MISNLLKLMHHTKLVCHEWTSIKSNYEIQFSIPTNFFQQTITKITRVFQSKYPFQYTYRSQWIMLQYQVGYIDNLINRNKLKTPVRASS